MSTQNKQPYRPVANDPNRSLFILLNNFNDPLRLDPIKDTYSPTQDLKSFQIWDIHPPRMESYFKSQGFKIRYLLKEEIENLNIKPTLLYTSN